MLELILVTGPLFTQPFYSFESLLNEIQLLRFIEERWVRYEWPRKQYVWVLLVFLVQFVLKTQNQHSNYENARGERRGNGR